MSLLLDDGEWPARRAIAVGSLRPLAESLAAELEPLLARDLFIPPEKAMLTKAGGRCPRDGAMLIFDPRSPRAHRCQVCNAVHAGDEHYRYWIYWYQLWLAERALHGAVLASAGLGQRYADFSRQVLDAYAGHYLEYPNSDNVLGPTRLFFSTYLESIWLLQVCIAADLLGRLGDDKLAGRVADRVVQPSVELIASFDEGASNRQTWNNAAMLAAGALLGQSSICETAVYGDSGLLVHLGGALLSDGTWYEGENYHLFAHRGLWYGVTMAERRAMEVPDSLLKRFHSGFAAPVLTALPDLTLPARRDSQYAISIRQWRFAELFELGLARGYDAVIAGALQRLYTDDVPRGDTGRWRSSAEVERNEPASSLSRADLGWRSLLHAVPELPISGGRAPSSVLLDAQGLAVFRRDAGRTYVALDYGHSGGGHGHPDRLNLLLSVGATRWLDDMGTGSYVDRSLHWYRSTLAHNAPLVNGTSQRRVHGRLLAFEDRGGAGWIEADAEGITPGVRVVRRLVVMPGYFVDDLEWSSARDCMLALPVHAELRTDALAFEEADPPSGAGGLQDGFDFITAAERAVCKGEPVRFTAGGSGSGSGSGAPSVWVAPDRPAVVWRFVAPGPAGAPHRSFLMVEMQGTRGRIRTVWAWSARLASLESGDSISVTHADGTQHVHRRVAHGWSIQLLTQSARSGIDLGGLVPADDRPVQRPVPQSPRQPELELRPGEFAAFELAREHYLRSEQDWYEAGQPRADVQLTWDGARLACSVDVENVECTFVPSEAVNSLDNESADVNGAGVQLYLIGDGRLAAWMLVPQLGSSTVRTRPLVRGAAALTHTEWNPTDSGFRLDAVIEAAPGPYIFDLVVNERPAGRARRRGQLVLSGAAPAGGWVYLRGDRHDPGPGVPLRLHPPRTQSRGELRP